MSPFASLLLSLALLAAVPSAGPSLVSADGEWHLSAVGNPQYLTVTQDGAAEPLRKYSVVDSHDRPTTVTCLIEARSRDTFIGVLAGSGEMWEMARSPDAPPVFPGFVHNYRKGQVEGIEAEPQPFARRRMTLPLDHDRLVFTPMHTEVVGLDKSGEVRVFNLDAERSPASFGKGSPARLAAIRFLAYGGETVMAMPAQEEGAWQLISTQDWREAARLTDLPGSTVSEHSVCGH